MNSFENSLNKNFNTDGNAIAVFDEQPLNLSDRDKIGKREAVGMSVSLLPDYSQNIGGQVEGNTSVNLIQSLRLP
ncbi:hypothetical protein [Scytonema sp. NUACC26]|uniref:hypothetical protein n=1 Tax=Scytonema sp. NUACC26 TaxID=3140176 RepID=UPI0034DBB407